MTLTNHEPTCRASRVPNTIATAAQTTATAWLGNAKRAHFFLTFAALDEGHAFTTKPIIVAVYTNHQSFPRTLTTVDSVTGRASMGMYWAE